MDEEQHSEPPAVDPPAEAPKASTDAQRDAVSDASTAEMLARSAGVVAARLDSAKAGASSADGTAPLVPDRPAPAHKEAAQPDLHAPSDADTAQEGPQVPPGLSAPSPSESRPSGDHLEPPPPAAAPAHTAGDVELEAPASREADAADAEQKERAEEQLAAAPVDAQGDAPDEDDSAPIVFEAEMRKLKEALDFSNLLRHSSNDDDDTPLPGDETEEEPADEPAEERPLPVAAETVVAEPAAAEPAQQEHSAPDSSTSPATADVSGGSAGVEEPAPLERVAPPPVVQEVTSAPEVDVGVDVDVPLQLSELTVAACAAAMAYMTSLSQTEPALGEGTAGEGASSQAAAAAPQGQRHMPTVPRLSPVASLPGVPARPLPAALARQPGQGGVIPPSLLEQSIADHTVAAQLLAALRESAADLLNSVPGGIDGAAAMTAHADALTVAAQDTAQVMTDALDMVVQRHNQLTAKTSSTVLSAMSDLSKPAIGVIARVAGASSAAEVENAVASTAALAYNIVNCEPERDD
jgi:hypothetical protein